MNIMRISPRSVLSIALSLAGALVVTACAGGTRGGAGSTSAGGMSPAEIEAIYNARVESARMRYTDADVSFMTGMIHHHAQAIEMSRLAPTHGASPQVLTLAARIINAQKDEIATMQRWLEDRRQPVPEVATAEPGGMGHDHHHPVQMPGMLTAEQLRSLEGAHGPEFDRLFLSLMIQHHEGAVTMVRELFSTDGAGQDEEVFKFASDAQVDQATEIARMKLMLAELG